MNKIAKPHNDNDVFAKVRWYDYDLKRVRTLLEIKYGDIKAGSTYEKVGILGEELKFGKMELKFKNKVKFAQILEKIDTNPLCIEVLLYTQEELDTLGYFNEYYFIEGEKYSEEKASFNEEMKITAFSFEEAIEDKTICEHNVEYSTINVDADGQPIEPENFNKIKYINVNQGEIIVLLYYNNMIHPLFRNYGGLHDGGIDLARQVKGIEDIEYFASDQFGKVISIITEKNSLTQIRRKIYNIGLDQGYYGFYPNMALQIQNGIFKLRFKFTSSLNINKNDLDLKIIYRSRANDFSSSVNDVLVESDKIDLQYSRQVRSRPNVWKNKEKLGSSSPDEEFGKNTVEYTEPLKSKAQEILANGTPKDIIELEIKIQGKEYFKDINPLQLIELNGFDLNFDGKYRVDKISAVIEETYTSYSIDEMTKIQ